MPLYEIFLSSINAVLPIVLLIFIGYFLKKIKFLSDGFLSGANKVVFRFALPMMLFLNVYRVDSLDNINWNVVWFAIAGILTLFSMGLLSVFLFTKNNLQKGVVLQNVVRCNFAIIGIPLVALLTGNNPEALMITSVLTLFVIPLTNILAIVALTIYPKGVDEEGNVIQQKINWGYTLKKIITNPLIIGILSGFVVVMIRPLIGGWTISDRFPNGWTIQAGLPFIYTVAAQIAAMTSPLALIVMGGAFKFASVKKLWPQIVHGTMWRVIIAPSILITLAVVFREPLGFNQTIFPAFIALFAAPVAVTSAVMAEEMGNDGELAGQLVVWNSVVAVFTIFTIVMILMSMGLV